MTYFVAAQKRGLAPRAHPLLLSLTTVFGLSDKAPKLASISENDPRVLIDPYYTPRELFPPLDMHFSDQNGTSPLSITNNLALTYAVNCLKCQLSEPEGPEGPEGGTVSSPRKKGKKHRRDSSGGNYGNPLIFNSAELTESSTTAAENQ